MMGDFEEVGDDLVDTDSFINHRGAGEEPFFIPDGNESDSSGEDNDAALEWSHADLSAIMDELELFEEYSEEDRKEYELLDWIIPPEELENFVETDDEDKPEAEQSDDKGRLNSNWEEWYDYPYGRDFIEDFHCLQNTTRDVRNDLLDMLNERPCQSRSEPESEYPFLHDEVEDAINDILIPGMSREGLRRLHKIVLREPTLNLKKYLENADPYVLAYIIWGLNFYLSRHAKDKWKKNLPRIIECGTQCPQAIVNKEENGGLTTMIYSMGLKLLSWLCDILKGMNIGTSYEDVLRQFYLIGPLRSENEMDFIR